VNLFPEKYLVFISELSIIASFLGLILSAIGLWLSILVLKEAKIFKKFILSKVRIPNLEKSLADIYTKINSILRNNNPDIQKILELLSQAVIYAQSVSEKVQDHKIVSEQCQQFLNSLSSEKLTQHITISEVRDKMTQLSALVVSLSEYNKDSYLR
jgi:hypothetical protein